MSSTRQALTAGRFLLLTFAYVLSGWVGLRYAYVGNDVTLIWPPSGIALALIWRWGPRYLPAVWLGALGLNLLNAGFFNTVFLLATGNTLEIAVAYWLLATVSDFQGRFTHRRELSHFLIFGAGLAPLIAAVIGPSSLALAGRIDWRQWSEVAQVWWLGDASGVLTFAPPLLLLLRKRWRGAWKQRRAELALHFVAIVLINLMLFTDQLPQNALFSSNAAYIAFLPLLWTAMRFDPLTTSLGTLLTACFAIHGTVHGMGPFAHGSLQLSLTDLWLFFTISSLTALLVASLLAEQREAQAELQLAASVYEASGEGIMICNADNRIVSVNKTFAELTGYQPEEVLGKTPSLLSSGRHSPQEIEAIWDSLQAKGRWRGELWNRRKNGEQHPVWLTITALSNLEGQVTRYIAIFSDITERKAAESHIRFLAQHDPLTGLANRVLLLDRLQQCILQAQREQQQVAVFALDLDNFKVVNDSLGHRAGDRLLQAVCERLKATVRAGDTISRSGGDEFVVIAAGIRDYEDAMQIAGKMAASLGQPLELSSQTVSVSVSMGVSVYPLDGDNAELLLKHADAAMYHAKEKGRSNIQFFRSELTERAHERLTVENELRRALEDGQFELYFQPQIELVSRRLIGAEALIRWRHPKHGLVAPARFIPIAEASGLIVPIGEWVLREAARIGAEWRQRGHHLRIAVNISALQFQRSDLLATVSRTLKQEHLDGGALELELTESVLMHDAEGVMAQLEGLGAVGLHMSIDDFGTGYSSLSYLKRLPIKTLKIDQSFVRDIGIDPNDNAIIEAIVRMAHSLKLGVIAEGVETEAQYEFLRALDCDFVQGYLIARPMPAEQFETQWLENGRKS